MTWLPNVWKEGEENETEVSQGITQAKPEKILRSHLNAAKSSQLCLRHCGGGVVYSACDCKDRCDCSRAMKLLKNNLTGHEMCYVFCMPSGRILSASCKDFNPDICVDFI
ncbi:hypothetical protein D918_01207 [Trichuris suis]|nr:hypothetical protein D918_01207 [Trichuris suis]